jgi:hypothetical protein
MRTLKHAPSSKPPEGSVTIHHRLRPMTGKAKITEADALALRTVVPSE